MDKGIRPYACRTFIETIPQLQQLGNRGFRKTVMEGIKEAFGLTELQASTHYNYAFKEARKTHADQLIGLGRPEDKKGGRKRKAVAEAAADTQEQQTQAAEGEQQQEQTAETQEPTAETQEATAEEQPAAEQEQQPAAEAEPQQQFTVIRVKDGTVIAAGLTEAAAAALVQRAAQRKKAKQAIH